MLQTQAFERKTFVVEAVRVTLANMPEVINWCGGTLKKDDQNRPYIAIDVRRPANAKQTMAYEGDWVLRAGTGFRIYTDHAFHKSFEPTEKPVSPDPYQTGGLPLSTAEQDREFGERAAQTFRENVFNRPGIDRQVVVERSVGEEATVQPGSVEQVLVVPETDSLGQKLLDDTVPQQKAGEPRHLFRSPEQIREAHRTGSTGYLFSDGSPVLPEDLTGPVASDGKHSTYRENYFAEHGHYPEEDNIDQQRRA